MTDNQALEKDVHERKPSSNFDDYDAGDIISNAIKQAEVVEPYAGKWDRKCCQEYFDKVFC